MNIIKGLIDYFKDKGKTDNQDNTNDILIDGYVDNKDKLSLYDNDIISIMENLKKCDNKIFIYSKDFLKSKAKVEKELANELNNYQKKFMLPNLIFTDNEWIELFSILYDYFKDLNREQDSYKLLTFLQKRTIAATLASGENSISINDYLDNLKYINIENQDINEIRARLIKKVGCPKIVDIKSYAKRKEKKKQIR